MRKALLITALALLVAFAAYATESDPSNTVGFIKFQRNGYGFASGYSPFSLPFNYYQPGYIPTTSEVDIIGNQAMDGDELWSQNTGTSSLFYLGDWFNFGLVLDNTDAFWYVHLIYTDTVNVTTAGEVNTSAILYGPIGTGFSAYGIPIAASTLASSLDIDDITPDPTYLEVWDQITGGTNFYFGAGSWWPDDPILPGYPIWIYNPGAATGAWTYNPGDDPLDGSTSAVRVSPIAPETRSVDRATTPSNTKNAPSPNRRVR